ncbi:IS110 family transposase, partial [Actinosynnema sp. NPDC023658]
LVAFALGIGPAGRVGEGGERDQGKKHNAALICLARRRCDELFAMLRHKTYYRHPEPAPAPTAA